MRYIFLIVSLVVLVLACPPSPCCGEEGDPDSKKTQSEALEKKKESIRVLYNDSVVSQKELEEKVEKNKKKARVENAKEKIDEYYKLAKNLEKRGEYKEAIQCYKKIKGLTNDYIIKSFIAEKNRELRIRAREERKKALKKMRTERIKLANKKRREERERKEAKKKALLENMEKKRLASEEKMWKDKSWNLLGWLFGSEKREKKPEKPAVEKIAEKRPDIEESPVEELAGEETEEETEVEELSAVEPDIEEPAAAEAETDKIEAEEFEELVRASNEAIEAALPPPSIPEKKDTAIAQREKELAREKIFQAKYLVKEGDRIYKRMKYKEALEVYKKAIESLKEAEDISPDSIP